MTVPAHVIRSVLACTDRKLMDHNHDDALAADDRTGQR